MDEYIVAVISTFALLGLACVYSVYATDDMKCKDSIKFFADVQNDDCVSFVHQYCSNISVSDYCDEIHKPIYQYGPDFSFKPVFIKSNEDWRK